MNRNELTTQVARLFYAAGLLRDEEIKDYDARHGRQKSFLEVLKQDVSLGTLKDLMNVEVGFATRSGNDLGHAFHEGLTVNNLVTDEELIRLFESFKPAPATVAEPLIQEGLLSRAEFEAELKRATQREDNIYEWLVRSGGLGAAAVCRWLGNTQSRAINRSALSLSLFLLRRNGKIEEEAHQRALAVLGDWNSTVAQLATALGSISDSDLISVLDGDMALPYANLTQHGPDAGLFAKFPQTFIRRQLFAPIEIDGTTLRLAGSDPLNVGLSAFLFWVTGSWPQPMFAPAREVIETLNALYDRPSGAAAKAPEPAPRKTEARPQADKKPSPEPEPNPEPAAAPRTSPRDSIAPAEADAPLDQTSAVQLVSSIIENAIVLRTTDIHLESSRESMTVRYRIDGDLHKIMTVPATLAPSVISRIKILANLDVTERRRPQDGHFELKSNNDRFDFRISTLPISNGEKIVVRILESARVITGLGDIGLLPGQQKAVEKFIAHPNGMILVTGPTGSGKTSTLYAALSVINSERRNLVTIEDPVEYQLPGINQVQVDPHIGLTFSEGLRSILRQDPDVIMVGEIRDADTALIGIRAALTGHLMFSTLHTNSALGSIEALMHLGAMPFMIANSLIGIVSQRLVRLLCTECRKKRRVTKLMAVQLGLSEKSRKQIYELNGCEQCLNTGYRGRTGIFEVITVTPTVRSAIARYETPDELEQIARDEKMMALRDAGAIKVIEGLTSIDEVTKHVLLDL